MAATKAYTVSRRGSFKDYVDFYFIFSGGQSSLIQTVTLAEKKYGTEFNSRIFLEALIYSADVMEEPIRFLLPAVTKDQVFAFLEEQMKALVL